MRELELDSKGYLIERQKVLEVGSIRLDWSVDRKGYRIEQREMRPWSSWPMARGGAGDDPFFERQGDIPAGPCIVPNGGTGTGRHYRVGVREDDIYLDLANTVGGSSLDREDRALAFTNKWGFLANPKHEWPLSEFFKQAENLLKKLEKARHDKCLRLDSPWRLGPLIPVVDRLGTPILYANSLLAFCWLEFIQAVQGGGNFYRCGNAKCAMFGPYPKTGRPPKYCTDKCRKAASRAKARKA